MTFDPNRPPPENRWFLGYFLNHTTGGRFDVLPIHEHLNFAVSTFFYFKNYCDNFYYLYSIKLNQKYTTHQGSLNEEAVNADGGRTVLLLNDYL